jgi:mono/diheme cytochrome c family protein
MDSHAPHGGHGDHGNPLRLYFLVFGALSVATVVEMLPLFGLVDIPPVPLLALSAVKFVVVAAFFMHLYGDKVINTRLFFIPLFMAMGSVMVLMTLFGSWRLEYQETSRGRDTDEVAARYRSRWDGACNNWVKSPFTGNEYCASPAMGFSNLAAYEALKAPASLPEFDGFDAKSPEEKKAVLMAVGENVYGTNCAGCHQATGLGLANTFPPLAGDPVVTGGAPEAHINTVLKGLNGVAINGVHYATAMPAWPQLTDQQLAAVITYERNSWGNAASVVEPSQVAGLR